MSLHREKQKDESLMLIYVITLGKLFSIEEFLKNVIQLEWFGTSTNSSSSLLLELSVEQIVVHDGSCIKMISKENWVSRIILITKLFFSHVLWKDLNIFDNHDWLLFTTEQINYLLLSQSF